MKKEELRKILKLSESVDVISVEEENNRVIISIKSNKKKVGCPYCKRFSSRIHDYLKPSRIDYLSTAGVNTYLIAHKRRFECSTCKKSFTEDLGLTNNNGNVSLKTQQKILLDCMNRDKTIKQIAIDNNVSEDLVRNTFLDATKNYPDYVSNLPEVISFDEVSTYTGEGVYLYIILDLNSKSSFIKYEIYSGNKLHNNPPKLTYYKTGLSLDINSDDTLSMKMSVFFLRLIPVRYTVIKI